ncbi:hypothetical protein D1B31_17790 [Neobacillus notoginsengisoli]|uniref:Uncharacterized protein n=1 Tax=Neobacillus notoginsengisoli TaxID=1578198 RepID=A0A417YPL0_9BACI|nr:DUF6018 family natural product bioysynthesis protein [Neobacillus notoginsengisoli]RHW35944.1 hypothetical protein D1B31_17790 [Neobacillus notoginsengisoli]
MATMSQLLGTKEDVIDNCRRQFQVLTSNQKYRVTAEILLKEGERRIYRAKSFDRNSATREVLTFVAAVENATGETVMWRFKGEKTYHMSTNYNAQPSIFKRAKSSLLNYFFDLEA